jgi:hypothetical protein
MQREKTRPRVPVKPRPSPKTDPDRHPEWDPRRVCPDQRTHTIQPHIPP